MLKLMNIAQQLKPCDYTIKIIAVASPDHPSKFDCAFHACLFAKCFALNQAYKQLQLPCQRTILYEL